MSQINSSLLLGIVLYLVMATGQAHEGHDHGSADPSLRTWTLADSGGHLHASFVASQEDKVQVRRPNGQIETLELPKLSLVDREWVRRKTSEIRALNAPRLDPVVMVATQKAANKPSIAASFEPYAKLNALKYRQDANYFYVESNSMPAHTMMVGITAWQQQVPLPQPYFGSNAWRIPIEPVVAKKPLSAKSHFFRGAIALAANGVPIFNPIKNDGKTDTLLAGELDEFGGHCGRADDYHYHIAPTHLQEVVGKDKPIAYALDGYAIYGYTEPDGSAVSGLDEFNGHSTPGLGYHYHATKTYPYLNGGFHGEVHEVDGQVDPQPRAGGVREALPPWQGAKIIGFQNSNNQRFSLKVQVGREVHYVNYVVSENGSVTFDFVDNKGNVETRTYNPRPAGRGGPAGPGGGNRPPPPRRDDDPKRRPPERNPASGSRTPGGRQFDQSNDSVTASPRPDELRSETTLSIQPVRSGNFKLTSPAFENGQPLPDEFNGNGAGVTPPLAWSGAPAGTQSFALIMDHMDRDGVIKTYWNLYAIPPSVTNLPQNAKGIGTLGATWKRDQTYVPPHSAGGARQTYTLHLYALSTVPKFKQISAPVTREMLLAEIQDHVLDSAELNVTYQRSSESTNEGDRRPPRASVGRP